MGLIKRKNKIALLFLILSCFSFAFFGLKYTEGNVSAQMETESQPCKVDKSNDIPVGEAIDETERFAKIIRDELNSIENLANFSIQLGLEINNMATGSSEGCWHTNCKSCDIINETCCNTAGSPPVCTDCRYKCSGCQDPCVAKILPCPYRSYISACTRYGEYPPIGDWWNKKDENKACPWRDMDSSLSSMQIKLDLIENKSDHITNLITNNRSELPASDPDKDIILQNMNEARNELGYYSNSNPQGCLLPFHRSYSVGEEGLIPNYLFSCEQAIDITLLGQAQLLEKDCIGSGTCYCHYPPETPETQADNYYCCRAQ